VIASTVQRARAGDERAFEQLLAPHLGELHVHCYRMLGSVADAEDLLQETVTAAWQGFGGFAGRSSLRTWLYRIATNRCLNAIRDGKRRPPTEPLAPFTPPTPSRRGDVTWLQPYPTAWLTNDRAPDPAARYVARESIELAFIAALQRLPPRQTAALVLCDVLGFAAVEVAAMLDVSPAAVKGLLQRARSAVESDPAFGQTSTGSVDTDERAVAQRFADAYAADDIDRLLELLTDDAWLAMPPAPHEYRGRDQIGAFLRASATWRAGRRFDLEPTSANARPAFTYSLTPPGGGVQRPEGLLALTIAGDRVARAVRFMDAGLPALFEHASPIRSE